MTIGVAVITHRSVHLIADCLAPLLELRPRPRLLVVNSSSGDGTVALAERLGAETLVVPRREFNHGATRELARARLGTDIAVMMTPDARLVRPESLLLLVRPLLERRAAVAYARQLPHPRAGFFESFPRAFNYPDHSHLRSQSDLPRFGNFLYFCSNACAAWSNAALDRVGGFEPTLTQEDANAVARLLDAGERIAYVAEAQVYHSHAYNLRQEFRRHFDVGFERGRRREVYAARDEVRGAAYCRAMFARLARQAPWLIPYGAAVVGVKALGYSIGLRGHRLPPAWLRRLSAQDYYWDSVYANFNVPRARARSASV